MLSRWLTLCTTSLIQKNINKEILLARLDDLQLEAKVAFDLARDQQATGPPKRTPEEADSKGLTVVDLNNAEFKVWFTAIQGIFISSSTGKQASDNGTSKESSSDRSLGDVTRFSGDQQRSFSKGIENMRTSLAKQPSQSEMEALYGWAPGTAFQLIDLTNTRSYKKKDRLLRNTTDKFHAVQNTLLNDPDLTDDDFAKMLEQFNLDEA